MGGNSTRLRLVTERLWLVPLPVQAAQVLPGDRQSAARALGAPLSSEWPAPELEGVLRRHARAAQAVERFGVWVMIEQASRTVVGDLGFHGPPDEVGTIEIGYAVVPSRRRRGYATEAAGALIAWVLSEPTVEAVVAGCKPDNVASIATLEGVGFHRTGQANGEIRWRYGRAVG